MKHFSEISPTAERVVDAAEGLVQRHGYNGFSYDDVAQLVGIKNQASTTTSQEGRTRGRGRTALHAPVS